MELILDSVTLVSSIANAYALLKHPVVTDLLKHATFSGADEVGKQVVLNGAQSLKRQLKRVLNAINSMLGEQSVQQLETLENMPKNQSSVSKLLSEPIQNLSTSHTEYPYLLEELEALQQEAKTLSTLLRSQTNQIEQKHYGTGDNKQVQAFGSGNSYGGDHVLGSKIVGRW